MNQCSGHRGVPIAARTLQRGFSLLEVLVALAVMALSLGVLYQSVGTSTRGVQIADRTERATLWAGSLLARWPERGSGGWNEDGRSVDGFGWQVRSEALGEDAGRIGMVDLYAVEVIVAWRNGFSERNVRIYSILPQIRDGDART